MTGRYMPTVKINGAAISPDPAALVALAGIQLVWGRDGLFDPNEPAQLALDIVDESGDYVSDPALYQAPITITTSLGICFRGFVDRIEIQSLVRGSTRVWRAHLSASDPLAILARKTPPGVADPSQVFPPDARTFGQTPWERTSATGFQRTNGIRSRVAEISDVTVDAPPSIVAPGRTLAPAMPMQTPEDLLTMIQRLYATMNFQPVTPKYSPSDHRIKAGKFAPAGAIALEYAAGGGTPTLRRTNLCTNGSFEHGVTGWGLSSLQPLETSSDWAAVGAKSVKCVTTGASGSQGDIRATSGSSTKFAFNVVPGKTYTVTARCYTPTAHASFSTSAGSRQRRILIFDSKSGANTENFGPQGPNIAGEFTVSHTFTVPTDTTGMFLGVGVAGSSSDPAFVTYVDAIILEEATEPGAYFDGDTDDAGDDVYDWTGTPGDSTSTYSTVANARITLDAGSALSVPASTVIVDADARVSSTISNNVSIIAGEDWPRGNGTVFVYEAWQTPGSTGQGYYVTPEQMVEVASPVTGLPANSGQTTYDTGARFYYSATTTEAPKLPHMSDLVKAYMPYIQAVNGRMYAPVLVFDLERFNYGSAAEAALLAGVDLEKPWTFPGAVFEGLVGWGPFFQLTGAVMTYDDGWVIQGKFAPAAGASSALTITTLVTASAPQLDDYDPSISISTLGTVSEGL